jgi:UDP-glucose 4-epimerase
MSGRPAPPTLRDRSTPAASIAPITPSGRLAPLTWVIGASGLVGKAVWRDASHHGHDVRRFPVTWTASAADQRSALKTGLDVMAAQGVHRPWNIVWVAGAGVVGSSPETLQTEAEVFAAFLAEVADVAASDALAPPTPAARAGGLRSLFFASSAGGLYAGGTAPPFTEFSAVAPLAPYGHQKVVMESAVAEFARGTAVPTMIGRLTNVYGPGQNLAKAQGLVSQLGKAYLLRRPLSLYVSLDTIRDYVYVDDCARMIVAGVDRLSAGARADAPVVKIVGSGQPVSIAALLGEFRRLFRRRPPVVLGDSPNRRFQVRDLRMDSAVWPEFRCYARTTLPTGISSTVADLSARLRAGALAAAAA